MPVLKQMANNGWEHAYRDHAVNLLIGTFYHESTVGNYTKLRQMKGGPALGPYQIEPNTLISEFVNNIRFRRERLVYALSQLSRVELPSHDMQTITRVGTKPGQGGAAVVSDIMGGRAVLNALYTNLDFATLVARHKYYVGQFDWPSDPKDIEALAVIWDDVYNANPDHGRPADFIASFPMEVL